MNQTAARNIAFDGGHTMYELGPVSDVVLFFDCLKLYLEQYRPHQDWTLLTDRLYRRYLRRDELDEAAVLMEQARKVFARIPAKSGVEWDAAMLDDAHKSWLNPNQPTLAGVFSRYFEHFVSACDSAKSFEDVFRSYQPVRVVIADLPGLARDWNKQLAEYDALQGKPFWLR